MDIHEYTPEQLLGALNDVERKNAPQTLYTAGDIALLRKASSRAGGGRASI